MKVGVICRHCKRYVAITDGRRECGCEEDQPEGVVQVKMGLTLADHRARDNIKRQPRPHRNGAMFTDHSGNIIG